MKGPDGQDGPDGGDDYGPPGGASAAHSASMISYDSSRSRSIIHVDGGSVDPPDFDSHISGIERAGTGRQMYPGARPADRLTSMADAVNKLLPGLSAARESRGSRASYTSGTAPAPAPRSLSEQEQILQRFVHLRDLDSSLSNFMPVEFETTHL